MSDSENLAKNLPISAEISSTLNKKQQEEEKQEMSNLASDKTASSKNASSGELTEVLPEKNNDLKEYEYNQLGSDEDSTPQKETITREGPQVLQDIEEFFSEHDPLTPVSSDAEDIFEDSVEESQPLLSSEEKEVATQLDATKEDEAISDEKKEKETQAEGTKEKMAKEEEEKQCRICYGGLDDEPSFGKLISPCKCKGTMKYVHLQCLNSWRLASGGKSFFECDSCHYKYNFQRTTMAKLATNPVILTLFSLLVFIIIIFLAGFPVKLALRTYDVDDFDVWDDGLYESNVLTFEELAPFLSMTRIDLFHMLLGLVMVGIIGFLHFLVSTLVFGGPIPILGFGYRNGGFRGGNRGDDRFGGGILLILVAIGTVKAFWTVYTIVRNMSRRSLEAVGAAILEVHN